MEGGAHQDLPTTKLKTLYGAELLASNAKLCKRLDRPLALAMKALLGDFSNSAYAVICVELNIPRASASAASMRLRAMLSMPASNSIISELLANPATYEDLPPVRGRRKRTWVDSGIMAADKAHNNESLLVNGLPSPKRLKRALALSDLSDPKTASAQQYASANFARSKSYVNHYSQSCFATGRHNLDLGMRALISARCGNYYTAEYMATHDGNQLPHYFAGRCPFCTNLAAPADACPETLEHLILRCPAWNESRARWLAPLVNFIKRLAPAVDDFNLSLLVLGASNEAVPAPAFWYSGHNPAYLAVANFFQEIVLVRSAKLAVIAKCPLFRAVFDDIPNDMLLDNFSDSEPTHQRDSLIDDFLTSDDYASDDSLPSDQQPASGPSAPTVGSRL